MSEQPLEEPITQDDIDAFGGVLPCASCEEPIVADGRARWIESRPHTAEAWCGACLAPEWGP